VLLETPVKAFFAKIGAFLSGLRVWTINLLTLALLVYLVVLVVSVMRQMPEAVDPAGRVLMITPEGQIVDQAAYPSEFSFPFGMPNEDQVQARDLVRVIRAAAQDEDLAGVFIDFSKAQFPGATTALDIAAELAALREAGKPLIAFSPSLTTSSYLMAAQADEIYVHPSGAVSISGLGGYRRYTRELTDKLKITMHNYSQGDYKSAVEGLTRTDMSEPDRLQRREMYEPIWETLKERMAGPRELEPELFQQMADDYPVLLLSEAGYDNLAFAQERGVIDGTLSFPGFRAHMIEKFGRDEEAEKETYPHISANAYLAQLPPQESEAEDSVAVVFAEGAIQTGSINPGVAGADDVSRLIRQAYEDERTGALVLRVNSPGGSIIASDMIRDELLAAKARGLPVYISMGDVAASGGMWISTPADAIYAESTTITGSIGVAIVLPTLEGAYDYLGINMDGVTTSEHAGWGLNQAIDQKKDALFSRLASSAYNRFVDVVASSRGREPDYIRSIAGGRVWLGSRAQELGLVDELGSLDDAIAAAAEAAGLDEYDVDYVHLEPPLAMLLLEQFSIYSGIEFSVPYERLAQRLGGLLELLEGISRPHATMVCTACVVDLP
jgi:protease-4